MPEEICRNLYRIEVPLPESPLKSLNSYVVKGKDRNLVIDTGFNQKTCLEAMQTGLGALGIDLSRTDFFITHLHADHFGLVTRLATGTSQIFFSRPDAEIMESWEGFEPMIAFAAKNGFPEDALRSALEQHPGNKYGSDWMPALNFLADGNRIDVGDYGFECIETPGHTLGHICLYEPDQRLLIAGDHILGDITPNIQCWSDAENPLRHYLASLDKIRGVAVDLVLPGHRSLFSNCTQRIQELETHHEQRLDEVLKILGGYPLTAYAVASRMTWDIRGSWEEFPVAQKWFATGEAISHLRYLEDEGRIGRIGGAADGEAKKDAIRFHLKKVP
ncbi:MAG: MBL fold metallo-hydrolase [Deltaproteobacteria bacterium]|nr:MBL fold metallo-hydrolase [Deltaproteobacteria bacterium]